MLSECGAEPVPTRIMYIADSGSTQVSRVSRTFTAVVAGPIQLNLRVPPYGVAPGGYSNCRTISCWKRINCAHTILHMPAYWQVEQAAEAHGTEAERESDHGLHGCDHHHAK